MIHPQQNQQQYLQMNNKISGRVCFLATNLINMLAFSLTLYKMAFDSMNNIPWILDAFVAYVALHSLFGVICGIENDSQLLNSYKVSCFVMNIIQIIIVLLSFIGAIYYGTKESFGSVADSVMFLVCCALLVGSIIQLAIAYNNYKYINSLIASLSSQYLLGFSYPSQFTHFNQPQPLFNQSYPTQYPQLNQQLQQQNNFEHKQQVIVQPAVSETYTNQLSTPKQPFILSNCYTQYQ